jgi:tetratricopeptide (TPR) repeat protein
MTTLKISAAVMTSLPSKGNGEKEDSDSWGSSTSVLDFGYHSPAVALPEVVWFHGGSKTSSSTEYEEWIGGREMVLSQKAIQSDDPTEQTSTSSTTNVDEMLQPSSQPCSEYSTRRFTIQELQEITVKLEQMEDLQEAADYFKVAMYLGLKETTRITQESCENNGREYTTNEIARHKLQSQMLRITIIISVLRCAMAVKYEQAGDYERAISCCSGARQVLDRTNILEYAKQVKDGKVPLLALVKTMLERLVLAESCLEDRRKLLLKIKSLLREVEPVNNEVATYRAELFSKTKQPAKAKPDIDNTVVFSVNFAQIVTNTRAQLLSAINLELRCRGTAVKYLEDALLLHNLSAGHRDPCTGREHSLLARLYRDHGLEQSALHHFEEAAERFSTSKVYTREFGSTLNDIAVLRMRRGEYGLAVHLLLASLRSYEASAEVGDKTQGWMALDAVQSWKNLGDCYTQEKEYVRANDAFTRALNLQRTVRKMHEAIVNLNLGVVCVELPLLRLIEDDNIADTFVRLGNTSSAAGNHQEALCVFTDGLLEISRNQRCTKSARALLQILYCTAEACVAVGQYDKSISFYEKAIQLRKRDIPKEDKQELGIFCALCCLGIGNVYIRQLKYSEAYKKYSEAICFFETKGTRERYVAI